MFVSWNVLFHGFIYPIQLFLFPFLIDVDFSFLLLVLSRINSTRNCDRANLKCSVPRSVREECFLQLAVLITMSGTDFVTNIWLLLIFDTNIHWLSSHVIYKNLGLPDVLDLKLTCLKIIWNYLCRVRGFYRFLHNVKHVLNPSCCIVNIW